MVTLLSGHICLCTVQSSCDYICPPLPLSFSLLWRGQQSQELDGCQRRPARHAAETFTSQAGRDAESDRRRKRGKDKVRETYKLLFFLLLPVSLSSVSVSDTFLVLCWNCTVFARLCWLGVTVGLEDCMGWVGWGGVGGLGSESAAEERNKCINNKGDMTSGWGAVQPAAGWIWDSMEELDWMHHVCVCVCTVRTCVLSIVVPLRLVEFKQRSQIFEVFALMVEGMGEPSRNVFVSSVTLRTQWVRYFRSCNENLTVSSQALILSSGGWCKF